MMAFERSDRKGSKSRKECTCGDRPGDSDVLMAVGIQSESVPNSRIRPSLDPHHPPSQSRP